MSKNKVKKLVLLAYMTSTTAALLASINIFINPLSLSENVTTASSALLILGTVSFNVWYTFKQFSSVESK